jgi:hypothetical protein
MSAYKGPSTFNNQVSRGGIYWTMDWRRGMSANDGHVPINYKIKKMLVIFYLLSYNS